EDIGEHLPLDELAKKLYEIELRRIARHKRDRISDPLSYFTPIKPINPQYASPDSNDGEDNNWWTGKETTLQQDLIHEQRRRYDAEAERDNEIIRRQLAEGGMDRVVGDLQQLRTNARNQVNRMLDRMTRKQNRIDFLAQLRLDLQNQGIDPADAEANGRAQAIGHLRASQATLQGVNGLNAGAIGVNEINEANGQPGNELRDMMYGTITKEDMTIDELHRKIVRIGRRANYRPEELCRKFLDALPLPWLEKAEDI
ncbi:12494_t:CDS:2, partial [Cetraspora pellucida]